MGTTSSIRWDRGTGSGRETLSPAIRSQLEKREYVLSGADRAQPMITRRREGDGAIMAASEVDVLKKWVRLDAAGGDWCIGRTWSVPTRCAACSEVKSRHTACNKARGREGEEELKHRGRRV